MSIRVFLDTNILLGGLNKNRQKPEVIIRGWAEQGLIRPVICMRAIREGMITIGKEERFPDPMRMGLAYLNWIVNGIASNTIEMVDEPDKLTVLAARSRIDDHDDAWWLALAEREQCDVVTEDKVFRQSRPDKISIYSSREFIDHWKNEFETSS